MSRTFSETSLPLVEELPPDWEAEDAFLQLAGLPYCVFLDSAMRQPALGRYSFVAADPFECLVVAPDGSDGLRLLADRLKQYTAVHVPDLPPFQGGVAGLFSYDLGHSLEKTPFALFDEFRVPALALGIYDVVVAFDHETHRAWIISQGLPETVPARRRVRAAKRLAQIHELLSSSRRSSDPQASRAIAVLSPGQLSPRYPVGDMPGLTSNFSKKGYLDAVQRVIDYIEAGDVFQANLSQRLLMPMRENSVSLYRRLRQCNPAVMGGYFDLGGFQILSASPERFVRVSDGVVEARPIKGTRPRTGDPALDAAAQSELLASAKDRAENVMIVDLLRNDLGRVCSPGTVRVSQLCEIETCPYVYHLVSAVCGQLQPERSAVDLLRAALPGGSITGAPKIRAMEIIAELEPTARGAYCGALGYVGFDGWADLNILIRTITAGRGWWQFPVGGGIVAESQPEQEYEETWHKAEGLLRTLPTR
jgi:para-aminobenzoate synthetase component 1